MRPMRKHPKTGGSRRAIQPHVSIIIPVMNESSTLASVLREVKKLQGQLETIVVVNGSTDGSAAIAQSLGARVLTFEQALGHDVGRSVGARHATGEILLFLDGDMIIPAAQLTPFLRAVESGTDVALNQYSGPANKQSVHPVVLAKYALNEVLGRTDLRGASLTSVPHAISRRALSVIGAEHLAVPPKAQAIAVQRGLRITAPHYVNVGALNPLRRKGKGGDPLRHLIVGDHLEAISWYLCETDERGRRSDLSRNRSMVR